jgi:DMSO/TMAO reductase YedYZ molybdopterin-dependent catalytic subunit
MKSQAERTPPGQTLTEKWPVLHYADVPALDETKFRLKVFGLVDRPVEWSWAELRALPTVERTSDFHCVTTWSRLDNTWEGVLFRTVAERVGVQAAARHAMIHASDGYYTNVPLDWLLDEDVLFAWSHGGQPLCAEHGGPLRLVVPKLYAWKSAKWVSAVELMDQDRRGFWEERGYHNRGEPFSEERYSYQET